MSVGRRVGEENNWKGGLDLRCGKKRRMVVATEKEEEENKKTRYVLMRNRNPI